jgi:peptide/nickel transport system substrate-binding protein
MRVVERVEAPDKYTVRFHLNIPYAEFPAVLAGREVKIVPKDKADLLSTNPIGTGPFKFKEYVFGDHLTVVRNENYWKKGLPYLDEIVERILPEVPVQLAALKGGEIDILWQVPPESIRELNKVKGLKVQEIPSELWDSICMDPTMKPFDDVNVRLAVKYALNKFQLTEYALFGHGQIVNVLPLSPTNPYYPSSIPVPEQDYQKAKAYLAKAGLEKGFDVDLYVSPSRPTRDRLGVAVQQMLKPLNINANLIRVPWDKFVADVEGKVAFYTDGFYASPTVDLALYPYYASTGSWNLWHWKDEKTDALLNKARGQAKLEDRKRTYEELAQYLGTVEPIYVPYVRNWADAHRDRVKNFISHPGGLIYADDIWLEK